MASTNDPIDWGNEASVLDAVRRDGKRLRDAPHCVRDNRTVVLAAVRKGGRGAALCIG